MSGTSSLKVSWLLGRFSPVESERHIHLTLHSDTSFPWWGGCLNLPGQPHIEPRGLWGEATSCLHIAVKEVQALFNALESLLSNTLNTWFDTFADNKALLHSWEREVSKSSAISDILKDFFAFTMSRNLPLNLMYVPSKVNPPDAPSRSLSDLDCSLSPAAWHQMDTAFGPHTIDLIALPVKVQADRNGPPLRFFAPLPSTQAFVINVSPRIFHRMRMHMSFLLLSLLVRSWITYVPNDVLFPSWSLTFVPDLVAAGSTKCFKLLKIRIQRRHQYFIEHSRLSLVLPCWNHVLCSGISSYFKSCPFESTFHLSA